MVNSLLIQFYRGSNATIGKTSGWRWGNNTGFQGIKLKAAAKRHHANEAWRKKDKKRVTAHISTTPPFEAKPFVLDA